MANPILDLIEQVPKSERLGIVKEIMGCAHTQDALAVAKNHGINLTAQQFEDIKAFLKSKPSDAELRRIVEAVVPKIMVGPTLKAFKAKLGL